MLRLTMPCLLCALIIGCDGGQRQEEAKPNKPITVNELLRSHVERDGKVVTLRGVGNAAVDAKGIGGVIFESAGHEVWCLVDKGPETWRKVKSGAQVSLELRGRVVSPGQGRRVHLIECEVLRCE